MEFNGKKIYTEAPQTGDRYRKDYADGLREYVNTLNKEGAQRRRAHMPPETFAENIEKYRLEYLRMLGVENMDISAPERYEREEVGEDETCKIYRYVLHMPEGIPFYGILFVPHDRKSPAPLVIAQHGSGGTPELCADMIGNNNYKSMVRRALERGAVVFAPQLLLWRYRDDLSPTQRQHPIPYDRRSVDVSLKRFGLSITGLELTYIRRAISFFSKIDEVDADNIGMVGHSYGGYFTMHTMAADTRIKAGYASSFFNDRDHYTNFNDWCYKNSGDLFQDAEVAALCAPRKLFLSVGMADNIFDYHYSIPEAQRIKDYYKAFDTPDNLVFCLWEGGHSISPTDEGFDFLFGALSDE